MPEKLTRMVGVISSSRFLHDPEPFTGTSIEPNTRIRTDDRNINPTP